MTRRILLDATVVFAAASGEMATLSRLSQFAIGEVALSAVVYSELLAGAAAGKNARLAENIALLAKNLEILPLDRAAAEAYGQIARKVGHKRRRVLDRMVAAQALSLGLTLATLTPDEFAEIPGLSCEGWTSQARA